MKRWLPSSSLRGRKAVAIPAGRRSPQSFHSFAMTIITVTAIALLLTIFVYPSSVRYIKDTLPDNNDTRLIAYIIGQVQENVINRQPLFFGRFFFPDQNT
ncbi:hypothetical protein HGB07_10250, partial [Candidatus Roizmanbacteria bacterium]|nr:hypothetical protein [Candidatus Roizmanbacteria bacterium]